MKSKTQRNYSYNNRNNTATNFGRVNPKERLMNNQKRQKLRDLLIEKFSKKYNLGKNQYLIEGLISRFVQQEKLNDVDLQKLDIQIQKLLSDFRERANLKSTLTKDFNTNTNQQLQNNQNFPEEESIYPQNYQPPIETKPINQTNDKKLRSTSYQNSRPLSSQTYIVNNKLDYKSRQKAYKNPEEELAALESELAQEEEKELREKGFYRETSNKLKKINYKKYGDEWAAMALYDKKLYEQQILDEKIRNVQLKKRTKADLDEQVKQKIKKEYEEELKEKEYDKLFKDHQKKLDLIEKEKAAKIKEQYQREKESRQVQLKDSYVRKRIDEIKDKQFDKKIIKNIRNQIENEKKQILEEKKKRNIELNKALKENEINRKNNKLQQEKEKELDLKFLEEERKMDIRKENQREYLLNTIRNKSQYTNKKAEEEIEKMKKYQEEEDKKILYYMNEKVKRADEKEVKEKVRKQLEKKELKQYYDMQLEEKKKEEEFDKILDGEQARIWRKDCEKYNEDEKRISKILKDKNMRNLDVLKEQMRIRKEKEANKYGMNDVELAMNRDKLLKVQEFLGE
jgi:epidermal growth factor receptor substrate 15